MEHILFLLAIAILIFLPMIPSFVELWEGTDKSPLKVVQDYDTDIRHFAKNFKPYLESNFAEFFAAEDKSVFQSHAGRLENGGNYLLAKAGDKIAFSSKETEASKTSRLIVGSALVLPDNMLYEKEVYSHNSIQTGTNAQFRALLAEGDIDVRQNCTVLRWVHSSNHLYVYPGCNLYGRASADQMMVIADNCNFQRLNAPKILFGDTNFHFYEVKNSDYKVLEYLPQVKDRYERRWLIDGDLKLDENSYFDGDIVTTKALKIEANSHIRGSIKSNRDLHLGEAVHIDGAVFSAGDLYIGANCRLSGPVVAENIIFIENGAVIGTETTPTTISAPQIEILGTAMAFGTVWAEEIGIVKIEEQHESEDA